VPERQHTLRATIDWSYRLLDAQERTLLKELAPFVGGVRIDSAESIWDDAIELLSSLAEKSLLRRREDRDREPRFWLLETIRRFALDQATTDKSISDAADLHAEHFVALAARAAPHLTAADQGPWLDRLEDDLPNLRAALDHLTSRRPELALRMAADMFWLWDIRGYLSEGRQRLLEVLAATRGDPGDRARAAFGAGRISAIVGEPAAAVPLLTEAAALGQAAGDNRLPVNALSNLAWSYQLIGDHVRCVSVSEEARGD